jgi:hypothetical protein
MKSSVVFALLLGYTCSVWATEDLCRRVLPTISGQGVQIIEQLYAFKQHNQGQWKTHAVEDNKPYTLKATHTTMYKLSWTIKNSSKYSVQDGFMQCEAPTAWQLTFTAPLTVVYPPAAHGKQEDSPYQSIDTIAGIYLAKSKYAFHPDIARLMWHLVQEPQSPELVEKIIKAHPFVSRDKVSVTSDNFDQQNQVQLVAFNISRNITIDQGNQKWLITNAEDQRAIRENRYATEASPHNGWLPWFNKSKPEFDATSAQDVYKTTVVAPLAQASIFDRDAGQFIPDPIAVTGKMQAVYDLVAPLAQGLIAGEGPLFAHLVLQNGTAFELVNLEIRKNGEIITLSMEHLSDPSLIGLPSAQSLGFLQGHFLEN